MGDDEDWRFPEEAAQRRDEALRRLLNTPPKPRKTHGAPTGKKEGGRGGKARDEKRRGELRHADDC